MEKKNKWWRPSALTDEVLKKLEESLKVGSSIAQACIYAGISQQNYFNWIKKYPWFFERMEDCRNFPFVFSKEAIFKAINSKDLALSAKYALEFLKRRDPEWKDKAENTVNWIGFTSIIIEDATTDGKETKGKTNWETAGTLEEVQW